MVVLLLLGYVWRRRQRAKTAPSELAGAPGDSKPELHSDHPPVEMATIDEPRSPQELAGDEVVIPVREESPIGGFH